MTGDRSADLILLETIDAGAFLHQTLGMNRRLVGATAIEFHRPGEQLKQQAAAVGLTYTLSLEASNPCGASRATATQTITFP
jgi:hypothetical protein